jgi:hypothetical protein
MPCAQSIERFIEPVPAWIFDLDDRVFGIRKEE